MNVRDPRTIVTPCAFRVAPDLLGLPLAGPMRRALGMLIDLMVIGVFALLGWTATLAFIAFVLVAHFTAKDGSFGHPWSGCRCGRWPSCSSPSWCLGGR